MTECISVTMFVLAAIGFVTVCWLGVRLSEFVVDEFRDWASSRARR